LNCQKRGMDKFETLLSIGADPQDAVLKVCSSPEEATELLVQYATKKFQKECDDKIKELQAICRGNEKNRVLGEEKNLRLEYKKLREELKAKRQQRMELEYQIAPTRENGLGKLLLPEVKELCRKLGVPMKPKKSKLVRDLEDEMVKRNKDVYKCIKERKEQTRKQSALWCKQYRKKIELEKRSNQDRLNMAKARQAMMVEEQLRLYRQDISKWLSENWT